MQGFNTSYVEVHRVSLCKYNLKAPCFNTSYVEVHPLKDTAFLKKLYLKYTVKSMFCQFFPSEYHFLK